MAGASAAGADGSTQRAVRQRGCTCWQGAPFALVGAARSMPTMAEPVPSAALPSRRRWPRRFAIAALLLVGALLAAWWLFGDRVVCAIANGWLPLQAGGITVTRVSRAGSAPLRPSQVVVAVPPGRARALAGAASGWWVPPGTLGDGMGAEGAWFDRRASEMPLDWNARILAPLVTPRLDARLDVHAVNALLVRALSGQTWEIPLAGVVTANGTVRSGVTLVDLGGLEAGPDGPRRRFRLAGGGRFDLAVGSDRHHFTVPTLVATVQVDFIAVPGGWRCAVSVEPDEVECQPRNANDPIEIHLAYNLKAYLAMPVVDRWLNARMHTAEVVIPAWAPLDTELAVVVE